MSKRNWGKSWDGGAVINPHVFIPPTPLSEEEKAERRLAEAARVERIRLIQEVPELKKRAKEISRKQRQRDLTDIRDIVTLDRWREVKKKLGL